MKTLNIKRIAVSAAVISVAAAALCGCDIFPAKYKYMLQPEPTLPKTEDGDAIVSSDGAFNSYGYQSLESDALKYAYSAIGDSLSNSYSTEFTVYLNSIDEFCNALDAYEEDHPEIFWLDSGSRYSYTDYGGSIDIEFNYALSGDELENAKNELDAAVDELLGSAPENATDYELELYFNRVLIDSCEYNDDGAFRHNAYGALINGRAVCDGYAKAFQLLCNKGGIECVSIEGYSAEFNKENGESTDVGHMWNCVKIGGEWYHIDVTWNDGEQHIQQYAYFNLTTEKIEKTHVISPLYGEYAQNEKLYLNVFVPECVSDTYNYFNHECVTIKNLDDDSELIAAFIVAARNKEPYFDVMIDEGLDYGETTKAISEKYGYNWIKAVNYYNADDNQVSEDSDFYTYGNINVVTFHLKYQ